MNHVILQLPEPLHARDDGLIIRGAILLYARRSAYV